MYSSLFHSLILTIKLKLGISNSVQLENLELQEDILLNNGLPFMITEGKINKI